MKIINLGILAHVDAGKTTVTEGLLMHSGVKKKMGRVDEGTTTTDSMLLEQQRGMTIRAATVSFPWKGTKINLIDTPGHMDFIAEVERSLSVLDGAILVISAREGVQPQTRVIFEKLRQMQVPVLLFINKVDRMGVDLPSVWSDIQMRLTDRVLPMQFCEGIGTREAAVYPLSLEESKAFELIIESDDALLRDYLLGNPIGTEALSQALWHQTQRGQVFPAYLGAALHDIGVEPLLDAIVGCFTGRQERSGAALSAYIYKILFDSYGHKWAYFRVFSGSLHIRTKVPHPGYDGPVHVKGLLGLSDGQAVHLPAIHAGDIGILMDVEQVRNGDFLGEETALYASSSPAEPLLSVSILPDAATTRHSLLNALTILTCEDPVLQLYIHPDTEEITLKLYGVLQREIIQSLLTERFRIHAEFSPLKTLYREQPRQAVSVEIRMGQPGNLHAAGIALTLEPLPGGSGNQYMREVPYGDLEKPFQNAVEEGVFQGLREGLGAEVIDTRIRFTDMDYNSVDSTPADYRRLAPQVIKKALESVPLRRLEPWLSFTLTAPAAHQKKVLLAINSLRAIIDNVSFEEAEFTMAGQVPLDTSKTFSADLLSLTQGQGLFFTSFLNYREVSAADYT